MFTYDALIAFLTTNFNFTGFLTDLHYSLNRNVKSPGHLKDKPTVGCSDKQYTLLLFFFIIIRPPLWSSGQSFWLQIQRSRVRFPALQDFLSGSGSGTGYTQPREVN